MSTPNVLLLMVDQLNYQCLGYQSHPVVKTPNIDRLKRESVEFTQCYVQNGYCLPSRTSYLSGQYLFTHRQYGFTGLLGEETPSMGAYFSSRGYNTAFVGKAHVNSYGERFGFKEVVPTLPEDIYQATDIKRNYLVYCKVHGLPYPHDQVHGDSAIPAHLAHPSDVPAEHSQERYTANEAIRVIANHPSGGSPESPLFLAVSFDRPHAPLTPSPEYAALYPPETIPLSEAWSEEQLSRKPGYMERMANSKNDARRIIGDEAMRHRLSMYYALITHIDEEIGRIIDTLREAGLYDDTIVVFCSDHGDFGGFNGLMNKYSNKCYYDTIIRTPLLIKYAHQQYAGTEVDHLVEAIDLFPTLCSLTGDAEPGVAFDGKDLDLLAKSPSPENVYPNIAFSESYSIKAIRKDRLKLIYTVVTGERELYDLETDPDERENVYDDPKYDSDILDLKLELVKKLTRRPSPERLRYIESLFDNTEIDKVGGMRKLNQWRDRIVDGGGFWVVCTEEHLLIVKPYSDSVTLLRVMESERRTPDHRRYQPSDDPATADYMLDDLIDYISTTIRPVSLMVELE